jgi:hypothetical protein
MRCTHQTVYDTSTERKEEAWAMEMARAKCHEQLLASQQLQRLTELKLVKCEKELKEHAQRAVAMEQ